MRIISRSEWGARHKNGFGEAPIPASEVWLHHSVTIAPDLIPPFDDDFAAIRQIEQIGQDRFGAGISYTWLITPAGLIFEGHSPHRVGSHTANRNTIARAICFIGNYEFVAPTDKQILAAAWLLQEAKRRNWIRRGGLEGGHQDLKATACPGRKAYERIDQINRLALGPAIVDLPVKEEEDEEMAPFMLARDTSNGAVYYSNFISKRWIENEDELEGIRWHLRRMGQPDAVVDVQDIRILGVLIGPEPTFGDPE